jgi:hypothetical protein
MTAMNPCNFASEEEGEQSLQLKDDILGDLNAAVMRLPELPLSQHGLGVPVVLRQLLQKDLSSTM